MRRFLWPVLLLVVIVALVAIGVVVGGTSDPKGLKPGSLVSEEAGDALVGRTADVRVPWGRLQVTVSEPLDATAEGKKADEGLSFIGVQAQLRGPEDLLVTNSLPDSTLSDPEFTLVVGEEEYPLEDLVGWVDGSDINQVARRQYVAVKGSPGDYYVRVGYDGVDQEVSGVTGAVERGAAEALYSLDLSTGGVVCGDPLWSPGASDVKGQVTKCVITSASMAPYVAGLGWADEGTRWFLVTVQPGTPAEFRGPAGTYEVTDATPTFLLDAQGPEESYALNDALPDGVDPDPSDPQVAVFQVAEDRPQGSGSFEVRVKLTGETEVTTGKGKKQETRSKEFKALVAQGAFL